MLEVVQSGDYQPAVPAVWHAEVAGVLLRRFRARTLSREAFERTLRAFSAIPLETHGEVQTFNTIVERAHRYDLQAADALYFDLAVRLRLPIATLDGGLKAAAKRFGIQIFEP